MIAPTGGTISTSPWWGVPLIAGSFLIVGALIAFLSTYFSDKRKLSREDVRQWDKEIRDIYVATSSLTKQLLELRWRDSLPADFGEMNAEQRRKSAKRYELAHSYTRELEALADQLRLFAAERTVEYMDELVRSAQSIISTFHDHIHPGKRPFIKLYGCRGELLHAVQENLRLRSYRPYIRPPMSRAAKLRVAFHTRVNPTTSGKLRWWQGRRFYWGSGSVVLIVVALVVSLVLA